MKGIAAITGTGCVTAAGAGADRAWEALLRGQVLGHVHPAEGEMPGHLAARAPENAALEQGMTGLSYPRPARTTIMSMAAAQECWRNAGAEGNIDQDRTGCSMSRNFGQHDVVAQYNSVLWKKGPASVSGLQFVQTIGNTVLGKISLDFHLRGPSILNFGAPILGVALENLRDGEADGVLAGGVDELSLYALTRVALGGLAVTSGDPSGPYDAHRHGLLPGEGVAFLMLENPETARARGARALGYLRGHAAVTDRSNSSFDRNPDDIAECMRRALRDAEIAPGDVALICGAGTRLTCLDRAELQAIEKVFPAPPPLYSCKGALGETWGASAYVSSISALRALAAGVAPPTAGTTEVEAGFRVPVVLGRPAPIGKGAAMVLSFDMSGQNTAYIFTAEP